MLAQLAAEEKTIALWGSNVRDQWKQSVTWIESQFGWWTPPSSFSIYHPENVADPAKLVRRDRGVIEQMCRHLAEFRGSAETLLGKTRSACCWTLKRFDALEHCRPLVKELSALKFLSFAEVQLVQLKEGENLAAHLERLKEYETSNGVSYPHLYAGIRVLHIFSGGGALEEKLAQLGEIGIEDEKKLADLEQKVKIKNVFAAGGSLEQQLVKLGEIGIEDEEDLARLQQQLKKKGIFFGEGALKDKLAQLSEIEIQDERELARFQEGLKVQDVFFGRGNSLSVKQKSEALAGIVSGQRLDNLRKNLSKCGPLRRSTDSAAPACDGSESQPLPKPRGQKTRSLWEALLEAHRRELVSIIPDQGFLSAKPGLRDFGVLLPAATESTNAIARIDLCFKEGQAAEFYRLVNSSVAPNSKSVSEIRFDRQPRERLRMCCLKPEPKGGRIVRALVFDETLLTEVDKKRDAAARRSETRRGKPRGVAQCIAVPDGGAARATDKEVLLQSNADGAVVGPAPPPQVVAAEEDGEDAAAGTMANGGEAAGEAAAGSGVVMKDRANKRRRLVIDSDLPAA